MTADIAAIARGLSHAQRLLIVRSRRDWSNEPPRCFGPGTTKKALRERGLAHGDSAYLTPLGLSVRDHLLSGKQA